MLSFLTAYKNTSVHPTIGICGKNTPPIKKYSNTLSMTPIYLFLYIHSCDIISGI